MKVGIIIPDRGDRPELLKNCLRMMDAQTLQPDIIELVDFKPTDQKKDITKRYRIGYDRLRNKGLDAIALIENDDWYHPEYLETMINEWLKNKKPVLLGTNYTIYYHILIKGYYTFNHFTRASAMNTLIKPDQDIKWCPDHEVYTDIFLWEYFKRQMPVTFKPQKHIALGIKHGEGACGGNFHTSKMHRYVNDDEDFSFLKETIDPESYKFYMKYHDTHIGTNRPVLNS